MKKRLLSLALAIAMTLGAIPAAAYDTPDFLDVPQGHWAYEAVMEMADAGVIQGTGGGLFSPTQPLSAEMFLVLVGRIMFPEVKPSGSDWSGPYVAEAKAKDLLEHTSITDETLKNDISRYDMAAILAWCVNLLECSPSLIADTAVIADWDEIPVQYMQAVWVTYHAGLIRGDQSRFFHGSDSMTRQEAAVVMARLSHLKRAVTEEPPTALTVKGHQLSVADMDYYYYQAVYAAYEQELQNANLYAMMGNEAYTPAFDPNADLRIQYVDEEKTQSYHDYFLEQAKINAVQFLALSDAAEAEGYTMSQEAQDALASTHAQLDEQVSKYRWHSQAAYLKAVYGPRMTEEVFFKNAELQTLASDYYQAKSNAIGNYSPEELRAYYADHTAELNSYDYANVYFDGYDPATGEVTAASLANAKEQAEAVLRAVQSSDHSPEPLSAAAAAQGAAGETVRIALPGRFLQGTPYAQWLADDNRKYGDAALFSTDYGSYVIQFHRVYLDDEPTADFRSIFLSAEEDSSDPIQARLQTKALAKTILDEFNAGAKSAEEFGVLAEQYSHEARYPNGGLDYGGGLYRSVRKGEMIRRVDDWIFASGRKPGDTGLIETKEGWYILYLEAYNRPGWMNQAEEMKAAAELDALWENIQRGYEAVEGPGWPQVGLALNEAVQ